MHQDLSINWNFFRELYALVPNKTLAEKLP